jgi:phosphoribosylformimino-5-aminoimidazole carboxamide ribotide isomerase
VIFPAIDLRGGRCIRLVRGERSAEIDYATDPVDAARRWLQAGAEWIHAIDLGAALGEPDSAEGVLAIARAAAPVPVQSGGGLRDDASIERLLSGGVRRVILGTRALADPGFLRAQIERWGPDRIVLAMDVAGGRVRTKGWEESTGLDVAGGMTLARETGVAHALVTAIDRDGTLSGPNVDLIRRSLDLAGETMGIVAAGGIGTIEHIRAVLEVRHPRLEGVVAGRALYEGTVDLRAAVALSKEYRK